MMMDVRPLVAESDYDWALAEIAAYFAQEPRPGTPEAARFDVLAALIETYEARYWPIDPPDPLKTVKPSRIVRPYKERQGWPIPTRIRRRAI